LERIESIELLDLRLHCLVLSPHYEDGTNIGTLSGQNGRQQSKNGGYSKGNKDISTNQAKTEATLKEMKREMTAMLEAMIQNNQERMEDHHERMMSKMDSRLAKMGGHGFGGKSRRNRVRGEA
jgi:hypothetical protein